MLFETCRNENVENPLQAGCVWEIEERDGRRRREEKADKIYMRSQKNTKKNLYCGLILT